MRANPADRPSSLVRKRSGAGEPLLLLHGLGLGTVHIAGYSLGARVSLELASRGRARSVVAIAPDGLRLLRNASTR